MQAQRSNNRSNAVCYVFPTSLAIFFPCVTTTWACWFTSLKPGTSVNLRGRSKLMWLINGLRAKDYINELMKIFA